MREVVIGVTEKNQNPYWDMVNAGWADAADRLGLTLRIEAPEYEDAQAQTELMRAQLHSGVDALAFVGTDPLALAPIVSEARRQGVPVVAFDLDAPKSGRLLFVGMEAPREAGRRAGREMLNHVGAGATVIVQTGSRRAPGALGKMAGFVAELTRAGVHTIDVGNDHEDVGQASIMAEAVLHAHPEARGIFGVYGYHPIAQAHAVRAVGRTDVAIVGFDMLPETVELIATGEVQSSIWIQEYEFGYRSAVAISDLVRVGESATLQLYGKSESDFAGNVHIPTPITYTKANLQQFIDWSLAHGMNQRTSATAL